MRSSDPEDLLHSLGRCISEVRFKRTPSPELLDLLFDECEDVRIVFGQNARLPLSQITECPWRSSVISAHLESDGFSDWEEMTYFSSIREIFLTVIAYDPHAVDTRDVAGMQMTLSNLPELRSLVVKISGYSEESMALIEKCLIFPGSQIAFELQTNPRRRKKRPQSRG